MSSEWGRAGRGSASRGRGRGGGTGSDIRESMVQAELFTRPPELTDKTGTTGTEVTCAANFVKVETAPNFELHQYHVNFNPPVDSVKMRRDMLREFNDVIGADHVFDGMILYTCHSYLEPEFILSGVMPVTNEKIEVRIKRTTTFKPDDPQAVTLYNLLVRRTLEKVGYKLVGRDHFDPSRAHSVEIYHLELWPGFTTGVRPYEEGLMLCLENKHKLIRDESVYDMLQKEWSRSGKDENKFRTTIQQLLIQSTVITIYNNRLYRVDEIAWELSPRTKLFRDNDEVAICEYLFQQYGITIKDLDQPLVVSYARATAPDGSRHPIYLVPEQCHLTGLNEQMRSDQRVMRELSNHTRVEPSRRIFIIRDFLHTFHEKPEVRKIMESWNTTLAEDVVEFNARELPMQTIVGANNSEIAVNAQRGEWSSGVSRGRPFRVEDLRANTWMILFPLKFQHLAEKFFSKCRELGTQMGMTIEDPVTMGVERDDFEEYRKVFRSMLGYLKELRVDPKLVVCIIPNDNKMRYDSLKREFSITSPVPSQMIRLQTLMKDANFQSIALKILLQMDCKIGGAIWKVHIPMKKAMIVGYDLYNDSSMRGKSFGACVSSFDADFTRWFSQSMPHRDPSELGHNLGTFVYNALMMYDKQNSDLPNRILIYRDGCGDGQIPFVRNQEIKEVEDAIKRVSETLRIGTENIDGEEVPKYRPRIAFTIVTKKTSVRFFKKMGDGQYVNPRFGTVVDNTITRPERFDFYLVPQAVNQGAVAPVNYNVIYDTSGLTPDQHQLLAFKLSQLYYNWQGPVRVPAPCQYAQKLAFLAAQSLHESPDASLSDKLHFL